MIFALAPVLMLAAAVNDLTAIERQVAAQQYGPALAALGQVAVASRGPAWYLLAARACDGLNDAPKAIEYAQAAIRLDARNEPAYLQLAQIFLSRNTPDAAFEILSDAKELFPQSVLIRLGLGLALKDLRRYEEAAVVLQECLAAKPDLSVAFDALGSAWLELGRYAALADFAAGYVARNPDDYRGYYYLAAAKEKLSEPVAEIQALLARCLDLNPRFAAAYALRGKFLLAGGDLTAAVAALEQAILLRPEYTPAHLSLASAYRQSGRAEDARREAAELARLNELESHPPPRLLYHRGGQRVGDQPHQ
jgi:tetratricopeptide (TPR) repeat protein